MSVVLKTAIPLFLLAVAGLISRKFNILKKGDERVLSEYLYYFAFPSLLFVNMSEIPLAFEQARFVIIACIPIFILFILYLLAYVIFRFSQKIFYLLIVGSFLGSLAFFGIPFITFAYQSPEAEQIAVLVISSLALLTVTIVMIILEMSKLRDRSFSESVRVVARRLVKNPLIISIVLGVCVSIFKIQLPEWLARPLHMIGGTTATIGIFTLGVFLYGRRYSHLLPAVLLSLVRAFVLPAIAFFLIKVTPLESLEKSIVVLMHGMPVAVSLFVLSERYNFYKDLIASLVLVSSVTSVISLNVWVLVLGGL